MPEQTPQRYQRSRVKDWRKTPGSVCVGRESHWGNPFTARWAIAEGYATDETDGRRVAVRFFTAWLDGSVEAPVPDGTRRRQILLAKLPDLAGRDLACWCPLPEPGEPDHCHAQILITRANPTVEGDRRA